MSEHNDFVPWYKHDTAAWLRLSLRARGAMAEVVRKLNRKGELRLSGGLEDLALLLHVPWTDLEPALAELIAAGRLEWDGSRYTLVDPQYESRRRRTSTERVQEFRARKRSITNADETHVTDETFHRFGNGSNATSVSSVCLSDLKISDPDLPGRSPTPPPAVEAAPDLAPQWFQEACEALGATAEPVQDVQVAWVRYRGNRADGRKPMGRQDAMGWVSTVIVQEQRKAREERRRLEEREEARERQRNGPTPPAKPTKEQSRFIAEQIARMTAERRKAGGQ